MRTLQEIGTALAMRRQQLGLTQTEVAERAGVPRENLSRLERGRAVEFGARKLLQVLTVLDFEIRFVEVGRGPTLDELRKERGGA